MCELFTYFFLISPPTNNHIVYLDTNTRGGAYRMNQSQLSLTSQIQSNRDGGKEVLLSKVGCHINASI